MEPAGFKGLQESFMDLYIKGYFNGLLYQWSFTFINGVFRRPRFSWSLSWTPTLMKSLMESFSSIIIESFIDSYSNSLTFINGVFMDLYIKAVYRVTNLLIHWPTVLYYKLNNCTSKENNKIYLPKFIDQKFLTFDNYYDASSR